MTNHNIENHLEWRKDAYGYDRRALYLYGFYVGCILPARLGGGAFRAWLMTDDEGDIVGKNDWPSEDAARDAVYAAALERINAS